MFVCHGNICRSPMAEFVLKKMVAEEGLEVKKSDYDYYDYLIGMDAQNIRNIERMTGHQGGKIHTLLEFCGSDASIADPWYTGDFERTYRDIIRGCTAFLDHLRTDGKIG